MPCLGHKNLLLALWPPGRGIVFVVIVLSYQIATEILVSLSLSVHVLFIHLYLFIYFLSVSAKQRPRQANELHAYVSSFFL